MKTSPLPIEILNMIAEFCNMTAWHTFALASQNCNMALFTRNPHYLLEFIDATGYVRPLYKQSYKHALCGISEFEHIGAIKQVFIFFHFPKKQQQHFLLLLDYSCFIEVLPFKNSAR